MTASSPVSRPRKDAVRNRRKILVAAGQVLRDDPQNVSIPLIAERAEVSAATVYRYFSSVDALVDTYLYEVEVQLRDYSHDCTKTGRELFEEVLAERGRLVEIYGPAMVLLRSREGFLARLRRGDQLIQTVRDAWERPIRGLMRSKGISDEHFDHALFLFNIMFDPREILDLRQEGMTMDEVLAFLLSAYVGALEAVTGSGR